LERYDCININTFPLSPYAQVFSALWSDSLSQILFRHIRHVAVNTCIRLYHLIEEVPVSILRISKRAPEYDRIHMTF